MTLPKSIMCQTITVLSPGVPTGEEDAYGNPIIDEPTRTHYERSCSLQPLQGTASVEAMLATSDSVVTRWQFYGPPDVVVTAADRVQQARDRVSKVLSDDDAYLDLQVDGDEDEWFATGTDLDHVEGYLRRWSGA